MAEDCAGQLKRLGVGTTPVKPAGMVVQLTRRGKVD